MLTLPAKAEYLRATKKNQLALLTTRTEVKLNKKFLTSIGLDKVEKIHTRWVQLRCDYVKKYNEQAKTHGWNTILKSGPLPWGEWAIEGVLLHNPAKEEGGNDSYYLRYYPYPESEVNERTFLLDNIAVSEKSPEMQQIFEQLKAQKKGKDFSPVCATVRWENILELSLLDKNGDAETDVV